MNSNFVRLSVNELVEKINKIPRVDLAQLPTPLEFAPNISKELDINLYIKRDDCTALAFGSSPAVFAYDEEITNNPTL